MRRESAAWICLLQGRILWGIFESSEMKFLALEIDLSILQIFQAAFGHT
jgi:hypothetical protein